MVYAGGLILFNPNATQHLPAAVNAAFLATLYADYLKAAGVPVIQCGPNWFPPDALRNFSRSQVLPNSFFRNPLHACWNVLPVFNVPIRALQSQSFVGSRHVHQQTYIEGERRIVLLRNYVSHTLKENEESFNIEIGSTPASRE